jgi:hypothetical protein
VDHLALFVYGSYVYGYFEREDGRPSIIYTNIPLYILSGWDSLLPIGLPAINVVLNRAMKLNQIHPQNRS